jgi:calcineurin-like phosphoesterase family protein
LFQDKEGIDFLEIDNPHEKLIDVNGQNILLIHGHQKTKNYESFTRKMEQKYAQMGYKLDLVLLGHIHETLISDIFARGGSVVGSNVYSHVGYSKSSINIKRPFTSIDDVNADDIELLNYSPLSYIKAKLLT